MREIETLGERAKLFENKWKIWKSRCYLFAWRRLANFVWRNEEKKFRSKN